jgi:outer membrane protein OmpA-like peptidoglycan-associated protein
VKSGILLLLVIFLCSCQPPGPEVKEELQPRKVLIDPSMAWREKVTEAKRAEGNKQWGNAARLYNEALNIIDDPIKTPQPPSSAEIQSLYSLASRANMLAKNSVQLTRSVVVPDLVPDCSTRMRTVVRGVEITKHLIAVEFEFNDTEFTNKGRTAASELAYCLKEKSVSRITLVGHTDETGTEAYNYQLSLDRANALQKYLKQQDIRINIRTEGKGEKEPLPDKPSGLSQEERYQLDRRVEVITGS